MADLGMESNIQVLLVGLEQQPRRKGMDRGPLVPRDKHEEVQRQLRGEQVTVSMNNNSSRTFSNNIECNGLHQLIAFIQ